MNQHQRHATIWTAIRSLLCRCALAVSAISILISTQRFVQASCGDYVFVRDEQGRLVRAADLMAGGRAAKHATMPASVPCHGPRCSRLPSSLPASPPVPLRWQSIPEGLLSLLDDEADPPDVGHWPRSGEPAHPIHHAGHIFRPPRF